ncbi:hypothetical protein AK830_g924 [Neonectria ditissima]|uniref:N-acetyltransferase domain-containing protein n=1 Tax=Neonectria ditissima TaxID=78410 RepID=A0A0P7B6Q8_9HYPO|nr:hypothetical protein AK830_g924 [Neonectria ditissima]
MSKPTFTISRASPRDVSRLGEIFVRAFDKDTHSQMKIMGQQPGEWAEGMTLGVRAWVESPRAVMLKATDARDGKIVGFVAWGFRGVELDASPAEGAEEAEPAVEDGDEGQTEEAIPGSERIKELETMTSQHLYDFMNRIAPEGSKCINIGGVAVDPAYEGQGIGSQLIRWGTKQADRLGAFSWVHASEAGWPLFEKHGYKEVERLTVDLDEWAVGPPPKDGVFGDREKWGEYAFRYMVRQPAGV